MPRVARSAPRTPTLRLLLAWGLLVALGHPAAALAQDGGGLLGRRPAEPIAVSTIVLVIHPFIDRSQHDVISDKLDGVSIRVGHWFFAQFRNSYGDTSRIFGVERHWGTRTWGLLEFGAGYRTGIVTGYDERLIGLGKHTPLLPLLGVVGWTHAGPVGVNVFWAYRAAAIEGAFRCC